jgi:hypothetical protein
MPSFAESFLIDAEGIKTTFVSDGSLFIHFQNTSLVFSFKPLDVKKSVLIDYKSFLLSKAYIFEI